jgi:hypothetical protein
MTTYTQRPHAFASERLWMAGPEALTWKDDKGEGRLAYADLAEVRLAYAPTRVQKNRFLLSLKSVEGSPLHIGNESYRGLADFEDRSAAFRDFVFALHRAVAATNLAVRFVAGNTSGWYALHWLMTGLAMAAIIAGLVFFLTFGLVWVALIKVGLIVYYLPTLRRYLARNQPRRYDPLAIPPGMLPTVASHDGVRP